MGKRDEITVSVIVPTIGRKSLLELLNSLLISGFSREDEVLLMVDDGPKEIEIPERWDELPIRQVNVGRRQGDWGMFSRNVGMEVATGDLLAFGDDDNIYLPDALSTMRRAFGDGRQVPHLFRVRQCPSGALIWADRDLRLGNVDTMCVVIPRNGPRARWPAEYAGDYAFIRDTCGLYPAGSTVWRDDVIGEIYPSWSRPGG